MASSTSSQQWKLGITALSASFVTFAALTAYHETQKRQRRRELDIEIAKSIAKDGSGHHIPTPEENWGKESMSSYVSVPSRSSEPYDETLIREQLARNYAFFGEEGMAKIRGGSVVIVGCGGVGSHAALMLARSGVSKIRLIDFDYVTLSSLNRHAAAVLSDVGIPKVECIKRVIESSSKWVEVDARVDIWRKDEGGGLLLEGADWVLGEAFCYLHSIDRLIIWKMRSIIFPQKSTY